MICLFFVDLTWNKHCTSKQAPCGSFMCGRGRSSRSNPPWIVDSVHAVAACKVPLERIPQITAFAPCRNIALEQRLSTVEESIERAGAQLTQIVTAAKVRENPRFVTNLPDRPLTCFGGFLHAQYDNDQHRILHMIQQNKKSRKTEKIFKNTHTPWKERTCGFLKARYTDILPSSFFLNRRITTGFCFDGRYAVQRAHGP